MSRFENSFSYFHKKILNFFFKSANVSVGLSQLPHSYTMLHFGEYVTPWTVHIFGKIADTTKANIYFIPSFRQYKLPTFSRGRF